MAGGESGNGRAEWAVGTATGPPAEALDRVTDGFVSLDGDWRVTYLNRPAGELLGEPPEALVGERLWDAYPELLGSRFDAEFRAAMESQEPVDFEAYYGPADRWVEVRAYPSETGLSVYARDATERHKGERTVREAERRLRTVVESSTDAIMIKDLEGRYLLVNRTVADVLDRPREEVLGRTDEELFGEEAGRAIRERERRALETEETVTYEEEIPTPDGVRVYETTRAPYYGPSDELRGTVGVCRDVTARKERERELRRYETLVETSPDPMFALDDEFRISLVNPAMEGLTGLGREEVVGESAETSLANGIVTEEEYERGMAVLHRLLADDGTDYLKHVARMRTPDDDRIDAEYHLAAVNGEHGADSVVGVVRDVTDHHDQKRRIRRQRDQLETLDRINTLVQETIRGVVGAPTREEIEAMVCRRLADSAVYSFAWIGERDPGDGVEFRTGVGVDEDWFETTRAIYDDLDVPDPGRVAMETGEMQVSNDVRENPNVPAAAIEAVPGEGLRSGVVVPLRYDDAVYGVLAVASPRPDAFSEREEAAFEVLGEVIGFAINATGNRRLLLGDAAAEVELRVPDESEPFVGLAAALDCRVDLERAVPTADDGVVHYVNVVGASAPAVVSHLEAVDGVTAVRSLREGDDGAFLAVTADGTAPARLVAAGATPGTFVAADGVARVTAEMPPGTDVHAVLEALHETFAGSRVTAKRFVDRPPGTREFVETVADRLTARQRDALGAALSAGYYEWPRASTAEEVADSMGISSATLHYHLRRAEAELVRAVLGTGD